MLLVWSLGISGVVKNGACALVENGFIMLFVLLRSN